MLTFLTITMYLFALATGWDASEWTRTTTDLVTVERRMRISTAFSVVELLLLVVLLNLG